MTTQAPKHDLLAHVHQEEEYDNALAALAELPKSEALEAARLALREARRANAGRGKRVVHEWPEAHDKAIAALLVVNSQIPLTPRHGTPVVAAPVVATVASLAGAVLPTAAPALPESPPPQPISAAPVVAKAPPIYRVNLAVNRQKLETALRDKTPPPAGLVEATVWRNDVRVAIVPVSIPGPPVISTTKASMLAWGPSYRDALMFLFRGVMGRGVTLGTLAAYVDPIEHVVMQDALAELVAAGQVEHVGDYYRISKSALDEAISIRETLIRQDEQLASQTTQAATAASAPLHEDAS